MAATRRPNMRSTQGETMSKRKVFQYEIGDFVSHKLNLKLKGLVIYRHLIEGSSGTEKIYSLRVTAGGGVAGELVKYAEEELAEFRDG